VEPLPDLASISDEDLKALVERLEREESEISYRRRLLQGRIDILRAERIARMRRNVEAGEAPLTDMDTLTDILSSKGAPPAEDRPA
jgi:hypothetical protein